MKNTITKTITHLIILFLSLFMIASGFWISDTFDKPSFEQILYHLQFGVEGLVDTDILLIKNFIITCIVLPIGLIILGYLVKRYIQDLLEKTKRLLSFIIARPYLCLLLSIFIFACKVGLPNHIKKTIRKSDYFSTQYLNPKDVNIHKTSKTKNLILIYVESLEDTFRDESIFGENLLSEIEVQKIGGQSFKRYRQAPGTGWTMAGIVSTQCGIPLKPIILDKNGFESVKAFLPNAECLGDILSKQGYKNIFIQGLGNGFAGTGKFFAHHGYNELYDQGKIIINNPKAMRSFGGGLHDAEVFEFAKAIIDKHEKEDEPYNITLLTLDTHAPNGTPHTSKCFYDEKPQLSRAVLCTVDGLADLVNYIKKKGYLENTNLVIIGDHLFMAKESQKAKLFNKERYIFNRFISNNHFTINRDEILAFDIFPTILYSLGFDIQNGKLGLGYSGFGSFDLHPSIDRYNEISDRLLNYSQGYLDLWKTDKK